MSRDWNQVFHNWAAGPSDTEEKKISNTLSKIRAAIHNDLKLKTKDLYVFVQGSYKNNVNVKIDSDIDVGVLCRNTLFIDSLDENLSKIINNKFSAATYKYSEFKNDLEYALANYFGRNSLSRGNKSFDIHENSSRVDADVVALIEYRRYINENDYIEGVTLYPDNSVPEKVINWPEQNYLNGIKKNNVTGRRFKRIVRILKKLAVFKQNTDLV